MEIPEICHGELGVKKLGEASKKRGRRSCQDDVVDVEEQIGNISTHFVNKEGRVGGRSCEAAPPDKAGEPQVLHLGRLLEYVQGLLQEIDVVGSRRVDEARRLLNVDHLVQMAVKKGILHIQLMYRLGKRGGDTEDDPDGGRLDNRTEHLVVVNAVLLGEPTNDPSGFVTSQRAVSIILMLEDPLATDDIGMRWSRYETPGAIVHEHLVFFSHSCVPIWMSERGAGVAWQRRSRARVQNGEAVAVHRRWQGACQAGSTTACGAAAVGIAAATLGYRLY